MDKTRIIILAILLAVIVSAAIISSYLQVRQDIAKAKYNADRAMILVEELQTRVMDAQTTDKSSLNDSTEARIYRQIKASEELITNKLSGFAKLDADQTWRGTQTFQPGSTRVVIGAGEGGGTYVKWVRPGELSVSGKDHVANRITAGTVNFGNEVIMNRPESWTFIRRAFPGSNMLMVASDLSSANVDTPVTVIRNHEEVEGILLLGIEGSQMPYVPNDWRVALRNEQLLFAPSGAADSSLFDAGIIRDEAGNLLLRGGGVDAAIVGRGSFSVNGTVILNNTKVSTGDPIGVDGMIYINTFDDVIKMYADGEWRILSKWEDATIAD